MQFSCIPNVTFYQPRYPAPAYVKEGLRLDQTMHPRLVGRTDFHNKLALTILPMQYCQCNIANTISQIQYYYCNTNITVGLPCSI